MMPLSTIERGMHYVRLAIQRADQAVRLERLAQSAPPAPAPEKIPLKGRYIIDSRGGRWESAA